MSVTEVQAEKGGVRIVDRTAELDLPMVAADETRFRQVLLNLMSNAVKYNRAGGEMVLDAAPTGDGMLRVSVADTGSGIPADKQDQLFEPFSRLDANKSEIEGTGIGLTITKQLVELMDGRIGFESAAGKGSTFWIELPLAAGAAPAGEARGPDPAALVPQTPLRRLSVLYVEDDPASIRLMEAITNRIPDCALLTAHNAELALDLAESHGPDIILMDIDLPNMNGITALEHLRANPRTRAIPVIALSANAMPRQIETAMKAGFSSYQTKPVHIDELLSAIEQATTPAAA